MKQRISEILEPQSKSDFLSRSFNIFIISLIILNVLAVALETMRDVSELYAGPFKVFEWFSMAVFSIEYGLRVWTCTVKPEFSSPIRGRIRYMLTPSAIIAYGFIEELQKQKMRPFECPHCGKGVDIPIDRRGIKR